MNDESGAPVALRRRVVSGMDGFFALSRLNASAIASTRALPRRPKPLLTRRFSCEYGARQLQLTVSHGPISLNEALPSAFSPVNRYAVAVLSLGLPSAFRSSPSNECVGSADWYRKIGATSMPKGASTIAESETRWRASVRVSGASCTSPNGLRMSCTRFASVSSAELPMMLVALASVYDPLTSR